MLRWRQRKTAAINLPQLHSEYAGLLVSLARQEWPDTSSFKEPELVWRMNKRYHVGLIVRSPDRQRIGELLTLYVERVRNEYHASAPPARTARRVISHRSLQRC